MAYWSGWHSRCKRRSSIINASNALVFARLFLNRFLFRGLLFRHLKTGLTVEEALALIRKARPFVNSRLGQIARLKELEAFYQKESERENESGEEKGEK